MKKSTKKTTQPKKSSAPSARAPVDRVERARQRQMIDMFLAQISRGVMGAADLRRLMTQNRQAIADWVKLGTPYAKIQAKALDADMPMLEKLLDAAITHEKRHPVASVVITP